MCSHAHRLNNRLASQVELLHFHGERFPLLLCQTALCSIYCQFSSSRWPGSTEASISVTFRWSLKCLHWLACEYNWQPTIQDSAIQVIIRLLQGVTLRVFGSTKWLLKCWCNRLTGGFELGYFVTPCDSKDLLEALDVEGFQSILQRSSRAYRLHSYTVGLAWR